MSNFFYINTKAPTTFGFLAAYAANTNWVVPQSGWYRIFCVSKSADGGSRGGIGYSGYGGQGGASGGLSASILKFSYGQSIPLTFTNGNAAFGSYLYATAAEASYNEFAAYKKACWTAPTTTEAKMYPTSGGQGYNGNLGNYTGFKGTRGGWPGGYKDVSIGKESSHKNGAKGLDGLNGGAKGGGAGVGTGLNYPGGGGGGGGSRLPGDEICPYISPDYSKSTLYAGGKGKNDGYSSSNPQGKAYPPLELNSNIILFGGGMGCGGNARGNGPEGTSGTPAVIIIDRAV